MENQYQDQQFMESDNSALTGRIDQLMSLVSDLRSRLTVLEEKVATEHP